MKIITHEMIHNLHLDPVLWYQWADTVLKHKHEYTMPAKSSLHFGSSYFNTMPSILPPENVMGVKVVNRYSWTCAFFGQSATAVPPRYRRTSCTDGCQPDYCNAYRRGNGSCDRIAGKARFL